MVKHKVVFLIRPGVTAEHPAWLAARFKKQGLAVTAVTTNPPMIHVTATLAKVFDAIAQHRYWVIGLDEEYAKAKPLYVRDWRYAESSEDGYQKFIDANETVATRVVNK